MLIYEEPKYYRVTLEYKGGKLYERICKFNRVSDKKRFKRRLRKSKYVVSYNFDRVYGEYDSDMDKVCTNGIHYFLHYESAFYFEL